MRKDKGQVRLALSDCHFPFHDAPLLEVWLKHLEDLLPDGVDILGDLLDCYSLSRFDKNPLRKHDIQEEIDQVQTFLEELVGRTLTYCDIRYSEGNHENRLKRLLWGKAKELAPIRNLTIPKLLDLKSLGIKYYPLNQPYTIGGLCYLHGDLSSKSTWTAGGGGSNAKKVLISKNVSCLLGHSHKMAYVCFTPWGTTYEGWEAGCLCRMDPEYIQGSPPWQQGWAVVRYPPQGGFDVSLVRVIPEKKKRLVIFEGRVLATLPPAEGTT
jgi:hypothetical protein